MKFNPLDEKDAAEFVGGASRGVAYLAKLTNGKTDPLRPENPLMYMAGLFTASGVQALWRHDLISLSPLMGISGESNCGRSFGWQLISCGCDSLVVTG